jgi:hypothetical protein
MTPDPPLVHAPDLQSGFWINTPSPPNLPDSDTGALLVTFSDFTCINCLRTLPYLRAWHRMYASLISVVTVHTPEFSFAADSNWVTVAAQRLGVRWPILMDERQKHWTAWTVKAWPTAFLVDRDGYIRMRHVGDRGYADLEDTFRKLISQTLPGNDLPAPLGSLRPEDETGAVCYPVTPELQADEAEVSWPSEGPIHERTPTVPTSPGDGYHLDGAWTRIGDGWELSEAPGAIVLVYSASEVNAVLAPKTSDLGEPTQVDPRVRLELDGRPPPKGEFGSDLFQTSSESGLRLDIPRLYNLVRHTSVERHELRLQFPQPGARFYAFSFGSCLMPSNHPSMT